MFSLLQRDYMYFTSHCILQKSNKTIFSRSSRVERQNPHGLRAGGIAATTDKGPLRITDVARVKSWCGSSQSLFRTLGGGTSAATPVPVVTLVGSLIGPLFTKSGLLPCMYTVTPSGRLEHGVLRTSASCFVAPQHVHGYLVPLAQ